MESRLTIGQLAEQTGVPRKTIRFYEAEGILPAPERTESRYRSYSQQDVRMLELVRRARLLDMSLPEVRELVTWATSDSCQDFKGKFRESVRAKMGTIDNKIAELLTLKDDLVHLEAHLVASQEQEPVDHPMVACAPETCTCLPRMA